jgi:hypothetical protein
MKSSGSGLENRLTAVGVPPHIQEDGILHNHRQENLKSYIKKRFTRVKLFVANPPEAET